LVYRKWTAAGKVEGGVKRRKSVLHGVEVDALFGPDDFGLARMRAAADRTAPA